MKILATLFFFLFLPILAQDKPSAPADQPKPAEPAATPAAPAAETATPAGEGWLTGSIELGYRVIPNIDGSFNTYRSAVNLGEGPKLFNADFTLRDPKRRLFDRA